MKPSAHCIQFGRLFRGKWARRVGHFSGYLERCCVSSLTIEESNYLGMV